MDFLISLLVRVIAWVSRFAPALARLGLVEYSHWNGTGKLRILLVGYNGARNTGADVRVAAMTEQLEALMGKDQVEISVMTLDKDNIQCYFDWRTRLIPFSAIFFWDLFRACCATHMVVLCEGSTLKSKFANALTLFFCEAAGIMKRQNKPCIAYGSEAGEMDDFLEETVRKLCSETYFIARTQNSLDCVARLGLKGHAGTDTAWTFDSSSHTEWMKQQLCTTGWDGKRPLLGVAVVNPFWWPVKPSLSKWLRAAVTGDRHLQFQKWYFFSWSSAREAQFEAYLDAIAQNVNAQVKKTNHHVVILGMERLDADACHRLEKKLDTKASVFLAAEHNGYEMTAILRQLSLLITSRYHAQVLSMGGRVPSVAVSMDERLDNIMSELGFAEHQLLNAADPQLANHLAEALAYLEEEQDEVRRIIATQLPIYKQRMADMGEFFVRWVAQELEKTSESEAII